MMMPPRFVLEELFQNPVFLCALSQSECVGGERSSPGLSARIRDSPGFRFRVSAVGFRVFGVEVQLGAEEEQTLPAVPMVKGEVAEQRLGDYYYTTSRASNAFFLLASLLLASPAHNCKLQNIAQSEVLSIFNSIWE